MPKIRVYSPIQLLDMALQDVRAKRVKAARNKIAKVISLTNTGYGDAFYEVSVGYVLDGVKPAELIEAAIHLLESSYRYQGLDDERYTRYVRRAGVYLRRVVELLDAKLEGVDGNAA